VVLQVGQILGAPGLRGNHVLPQRLHLCSVSMSMDLTLRIRKRKIVAPGQYLGVKNCEGAAVKERN
jgi:hypothetical protein